MITTKETLDDLAALWPVGTRVQHTWSRWTGTIVADDSGDAPGATADAAPAHADVGTILAVCVRWDDHPKALAWINTAWLRHLASDHTLHHRRERRRTR